MNTMSAAAINIPGTIYELVTWAVKQVLLLLGVIMFGLSAPLFFTIGTLSAVWHNPNSDSLASFGTVYLFLGPFACAIWMVFICHLGSFSFWRSLRRQQAGTLDSWREEHGGGMVHTVGKSIWFMVSGFFGSIVAEAIFVVIAYKVLPQEHTRTNLMLFFSIAPFAVFAPCWMVMLKRLISRND